MTYPEHWNERIDRLSESPWTPRAKLTPMFASAYDLEFDEFHEFLRAWAMYQNARFGESLYYDPRIDGSNRP